MPMIEKEMQRLVYFVILKEDISSYSLPFMLIAKNLTIKKSIFTNISFLNSRLQREIWPFSSSGMLFFPPRICECIVKFEGPGFLNLVYIWFPS